MVQFFLAHPVVLSRGLWLGLINKWRDRLKASLLLKGGQFER